MKHITYKKNKKHLLLQVSQIISSILTWKTGLKCVEHLHFCTLLLKFELV